MDRIEATYRVLCADEECLAVARAIAVELTVEVPERLIERYPTIETDLVAKVDQCHQISPGVQQIQLSFAGEMAGSDLTRWLNLLLGNCSMIPGVRLIDLNLPDDVLQQFAGPHHGISGVRQMTGVSDRPLVATALKPRGAPVSDLVEVCRDFVTGGGDLIKDDHNLIDDDLSAFRDRVERCTAAIREAQTDRHVPYLVNLMAPAEQLDQRLEIALEVGADGALMAPWILGLDQVRQLTSRWPGLHLGHPSMSGVLTSQGAGGIALPIVHGTLARLAGLDGSVFVNAGGRFATSRREGRQIAEQLRAPLGPIAPGWAIPAGGMSPTRIPEMVEDFGTDTMILIGGALLADERGVEISTAEILDCIREQFARLEES
ncbi:MAG: RuBisCO large subunit C-terminal-like domain-containing protein [Planctomycetota bacterium]|nr:RuBisCO large subunit C-terminal-like domain-containing protein [Planctomycetota bacterium]